MTQNMQTPQRPQGPEIKNAGKWVVGPEPQKVAVLITPDGYVEMKEDSGIAFYSRKEALKGARILRALQQRIEAQSEELSKLDYELTATPQGMSVLDALYEERNTSEAKVTHLEAALREAEAKAALRQPKAGS